MTSNGLLAGVRVLESSLLEPGALGMLLAELGADVIKIEPPGGDYVRGMAWPIIDGVSLLHWHVNRGKRSFELDLRAPDDVETYLKLVERSDVVIEAMRPGALDRRGLTREILFARNPRLVICRISGWGASGPYRDLPAHGIGFDAWAGLAPPRTDDDGFVRIPEHTTIGTRVTPVWGAFAISAALHRVARTGQGAEIDLAQSDVAAATNWYAVEGTRAYKRPEPEVTGNPSDDGERRAPGTAGMAESVRYQYYRSSNGCVLLMASEQEFWRNFCSAVDRRDLYERHPGRPYADHARGDVALQRELQDVFLERTTEDWVRLGATANCPIAVVHDLDSLPEDAHFKHRFDWLPAATMGTDMLSNPIHVVGEEVPAVRRAPTPGEHSIEIRGELRRRSVPDQVEGGGRTILGDAVS